VRIAASVLIASIILVAACSSPPPAASPSPSPDLADQICAGAYSRCATSLRPLLSTLHGQLVAVCDYGNDTGDVVFIDNASEAADKCSGGGQFSPSRVVRTVAIP
jgi:hypothetical protein